MTPLRKIGFSPPSKEVIDSNKSRILAEQKDWANEELDNPIKGKEDGILHLEMEEQALKEEKERLIEKRKLLSDSDPSVQEVDVDLRAVDADIARIVELIVLLKADRINGKTKSFKFSGMGKSVRELKPMSPKEWFTNSYVAWAKDPKNTLAESALYYIKTQDSYNPQRSKKDVS